MKIIEPRGEWLEKVVEVLERGGTIIYPTDTAYALGADAKNEDAIKKVFEIKKRPKEKNLTIAVSSKEMLRKYAEIEGKMENLVWKFYPGPITFIFKKTEHVSDVLSISGIGIRIPKNEIALKIIGSFERAITATSANISGKETPYSYEKCVKTADLFVDVGKLDETLPSTIIDLRAESPILVRDGPVSFEKFLKTWKLSMC